MLTVTEKNASVDGKWDPHDKLNCNTSCDLDPSSGYHKLHTSGHYTVSGSGGALKFSYKR
ncbi:MAG TPA: hypothetical protein P5239_06240 [Victivallales bacterium]|nr:hypothetical protein [Victivallales bacterium]